MRTQAGWTMPAPRVGVSSSAPRGGSSQGRKRDRPRVAAGRGKRTRVFASVLVFLVLVHRFRRGVLGVARGIGDVVADGLGAFLHFASGGLGRVPGGAGAFLDGAAGGAGAFLDRGTGFAGGFLRRVERVAGRFLGL